MDYPAPAAYSLHLTLPSLHLPVEGILRYGKNNVETVWPDLGGSTDGGFEGEHNGTLLVWVWALEEGLGEIVGGSGGSKPKIMRALFLNFWSSLHSFKVEGKGPYTCDTPVLA
eukprot:299429-Pelagomonas_calceolata.AAC.1